MDADAASDPPGDPIVSPDPGHEDLAEPASDVVPPQSEEQPQSECQPEASPDANVAAEEISMEAPGAACEGDSPQDQAEQPCPEGESRPNVEPPDYGPEEWEDMQIPEEWLPCPIVRVSSHHLRTYDMGAYLGLEWLHRSVMFPSWRM